MPENPHIAIIGGGAAGFFAAIHAAQSAPDKNVCLYEATGRLLTKVKVSGGGRCNVTHHCFDPTELVKNYPRGQKELRGPFSRFQPQDTVRWFAQHGVELHTEADGRMFPTTNKSQTIIDCLTREASQAGVEVKKGRLLNSVERVEDGFRLHFQRGDSVYARVLILATGGSQKGFQIASHLGIELIEPMPSLFTFVVKDKRIEGLAGVSVPHAELNLKVAKKKFSFSGPLLITHWGLSGPAVLKLSAFAARELFTQDYNAQLRVNFVPSLSTDDINQWVHSRKQSHPKKSILTDHPHFLPKRLWHSLVAPIAADQDIWAHLSKGQHQSIIDTLANGLFSVAGKGEFKDEFVTSGGISLKEIDFKTMAIKKIPGLFAVGELINVDGITGGFNFQNAWTTGFLAGLAAAKFKFF